MADYPNPNLAVLQDFSTEHGLSLPCLFFLQTDLCTVSHDEGPSTVPVHLRLRGFRAPNQTLANHQGRNQIL